MDIEGCIEYCQEFVNCDEAVSELAHLRADLHAAQERSAEQARQLEEAANIMATVSLEAFGTNGSEYLRMKKYIRDKCDAWLAANPAPAAEPQP